MDSQDTSRRKFLKIGCEIIAGAFLLNTLDPSTLQAAETLGFDTGEKEITVDVSSLTSNGQTLVAPKKGPRGDRVLIIRESATSYRAMSLKCTHKGCTVKGPQGGELVCPCHDSSFDLNGEPLSGPAKKPLPNYSTTYDATTKTVTVS